MNWFELSVKVGADESVPVSLPTIYSLCILMYFNLARFQIQEEVHENQKGYHHHL